MKKIAVDELKEWEKFECVSKSDGSRRRAQREGADNVFVFSKGKRKYGTRYSIEGFEKAFDAIVETDEEKDAKWKRNVNFAIRRCEEFALWDDLKELYEHFKYSGMTWQDLQAMRKEYWNLPFKDGKRDFGSMERWFKRYVWLNEDNFFSSIVAEVADCRLKSQYFGKLWNSKIHCDACTNMRSGVPYSSGRIEARYDVSLDYDPERRMAWYSEEYRGCGNGHYYYSLGPDYAVFCEDD